MCMCEKEMLTIPLSWVWFRERNAIIKPEILVTHRILVALRIVESLPNAVALDSVREYQ